MTIGAAVSGATPNDVLFVDSSGNLGQSATLAIAKGGSGQATATAAFDALSPNTTLGDIAYRDASNNVRLAGNITATREFLRQTGTGSVSAAPAWDTVTKTDVGLSAVENTALSTWAGTSNITTLGTIATGVWSGTTIAAAKLAAMVASGGSHAPGIVPDPPSSSGSTKYLREDATWAVPAVSAGSAPGSDTNIIYNASGSYTATGRLTWNNTSQILTVGDGSSGSGTTNLRAAAGTTLALNLKSGVKQMQLTFDDTSKTLTFLGSSQVFAISDDSTQKIGFFSTAAGTPVAQQTVTGSRGGNAALASLLTALANYGLVVDSSS